MLTEARAYLDTTALAKWYLNELGSEAFVSFLQGLNSAVISSLTQTEMRSLLSLRRRMGDLSAELESLLPSSATTCGCPWLTASSLPRPESIRPAFTPWTAIFRASLTLS
jgi:hypothetical protein